MTKSRVRTSRSSNAHANRRRTNKCSNVQAKGVQGCLRAAKERSRALPKMNHWQEHGEIASFQTRRGNHISLVLIFNRCSGGSPQVFEESDQVFQKKYKAKCSRKSSRKMRETRLMTKAQEKCSGVGVRLWQGGKSSKRGKSQASVRVTRAGRNRASFQRLGGSIKFYLFW